MGVHTEGSFKNLKKLKNKSNNKKKKKTDDEINKH